ncbi:MAG: DUF3592 domain-containing protein [Acidobacteriota bacterium]
MTLNELAGALFAALAMFGVVWALSEAVYAHASEHWPRTLGSIVTSGVSVEHDVDGRMYAADIRYRYVVDGNEYTCDRVRFGGFWSFAWRRPADTLTKRFPVGAPVTVAYDPAKPSRGVLEPGLGGQAYLNVLVFALFVAAGLAMVAAA